MRASRRIVKNKNDVKKKKERKRKKENEFGENGER